MENANEFGFLGEEGKYEKFDVGGGDDDEYMSDEELVNSSIINQIIPKHSINIYCGK